MEMTLILNVFAGILWTQFFSVYAQDSNYTGSEGAITIGKYVRVDNVYSQMRLQTFVSPKLHTLWET